MFTSDFALWRRKVVACSLVLLVEDDEREGKRGKTRLWIKRRQQKGYFANIVQELMIEDVAGFREMFRMKPTDFSNDSQVNQLLNASSYNPSKPDWLGN